MVGTRITFKLPLLDEDIQEEPFEREREEQKRSQT